MIDTFVRTGPLMEATSYPQWAQQLIRDCAPSKRRVVEHEIYQRMRDNTIILFSSDNGGPSPGKVTMNTPLRAGKGTTYEGGIRVCAFANWPGRIPVASVKEPIHVVDWYPTFDQ